MRAKLAQFFESVVDAMDGSVEKRHAWIVEAANKLIEAKMKEKNRGI